ncbi:MFS transporter [Lacibacterium aquatile]|uniref:MFS transporter n=1 Tax=Lacibacterium aquatile TaxID=1168082 RepID=A0ABW5DSV4_9PROT
MSEIVEAPQSTTLGRRTAVRLLGLTALIGLPQMLLLVYFALGQFENALLPELERKAAVVGEVLRAQVDGAIDKGIALPDLVEPEAFLKIYLNQYPELRFIALTDATGKVIHVAGIAPEAADEALAELPPPLTRVGHPTDATVGEAALTVSALALGQPGTRGYIEIAVDRAYVRGEIRDFTLDIVVIAVVMLIVAFEILLFVVSVKIDHPLTLIGLMIERMSRGDFGWFLAGTGRNELGMIARALNRAVRNTSDMAVNLGQRVVRAGTAASQDIRQSTLDLAERWQFKSFSEGRRIRDVNLLLIRLPLFLFVFAEELSRSFFPLYVRQLHAESSITWLDPSLAVSVPISLFMLCTAIATPPGGSWTDKFGSRRIFLIGAALSSVCLVLTAFAGSYIELLVWRGFGAIGYGLVFIASQSFVLHNTGPENRAKGIAIYVGAITAADICGPAIGGVLSDRFGPSVSFLIGGGLVAIAAALIWSQLRDETERPQRPPLKFTYFVELARNPGFMVLLLCMAVPAKLILTGFLFYLVPQFSAELGNNQASTGRIIMLYGLMNLIGAPIAAFLADRLKKEVLMIGLGGVLAGAGAAALWFEVDTWMLILAVITLGLGQSISIASQLALVPRVAPKEIEKIGMTTVVSVYRISERLGGVLGPFVVGAFVTSFGGSGSATVATGLLIIGLASFFVLYFTLRPPKR